MIQAPVWPAPRTWLVVLSAAVVLAATFVRHGLRRRAPVIPLRLFRDRTTALASAASVLVGLSMFGSTVYLSQYFQSARMVSCGTCRPGVNGD